MIDPQDLRRWSEMMLGAPQLQVELVDEQWDAILQQVLKIYNRYKPRLVVGVTQVSTSVGKYALPDGSDQFNGVGPVTGILDYNFQPNIPQFQNIEFSILYRSPQTYLYEVKELAWWMSHIRMVGRIFGFESTARFEMLPTPDPANPGQMIDRPFLFCNTVPQGISALSWVGTMNQTWNLINPADEDILNSLTLALAKQLVGTIRSKYTGVPNPGGEGIISLDGKEQKTEGAEMEQAIKEQLFQMSGIVVPSWG